MEKLSVSKIENLLCQYFENQKGIETLKFMERNLPIILEGAKYTKQNDILKQYTSDQFEQLRHNDFKGYDMVQQSAKKYLTPLNTLAQAVLNNLFNIKIVASYLPPIKGIYSRYKEYINCIRQKEKEAYIETEQMINILEKYLGENNE